MKKLIVLGLVGAIALTGCSAPTTVVYDKKTQTVEELEDKIEAKLDAENPGKYDVDISKEKKKKKRKKR